MICKLCDKNEADKKNTHYLTDSIIRRCLNEDGVNRREKGFMFDVSSGLPFIDFKFQRETSQSSIIEALRREPTDEEILKAKQNPFSVDNVFCESCENVFKEIEDNFINTVLPKLRGKDLTDLQEILCSEKIRIRKFFLLQVWRTSVCDISFNISPNLQSALKEIIYNKDITEEKIVSIPLNITYLNTLGDDFEYTKNLVGFGVVEGGCVVFLNDFNIQVFENIEAVKYVDLYGINQEDTFKYFTNCDEEKFLIKVIDNDKRVTISQNCLNEKRENLLLLYKQFFAKYYFDSFGHVPRTETIRTFISGIIDGKDCSDETRYTGERFIKLINEYFEKRK